MEGQFEHDLYNKLFSNQLESDEMDTLQQSVEWLMMVVDTGGPVPNDVYDFSVEDLYGLYHEAIDPENQEMVKLLRHIQVIPKQWAER